MEQRFRDILGFNIRLERLRIRYSQEELAEKANISTKHLTKIENGHVTPSIYLIYKLAEVLEVSIDKLCAENEDFLRWENLTKIK